MAICRLESVSFIPVSFINRNINLYCGRTKKISNAAVGQQQSVSTFCAYANLFLAEAKGWNLAARSKPVILAPAIASRSSLTAIATLSDFLFYCFPMSKADFEAYGGELGLKSSVNLNNNIQRQSLVTGSAIPRPGKARKKLEDGSSFSSFFSTTKQESLMSAGHNILSEENIIETEVPF